MPATTPSGIEYPGVNDGAYDFQAHMAAIASSTQSALNDQANAYRGTGALRNSRLTGVNACPEGALWADTDGNKVLHQKRNGVWWPELEFQNIHVMDPSWAVTSNALAISNFGRVAHLAPHFYQTANFTWGNKSTIQLGTFDDKWAPPPGGITVTIPMSGGYDNSNAGNPWIRQDLIIAKRVDSLPVFDSRIMVYNPNAAWGNTYTTPERRAGLAFSVSWALPY